MKILFAGDYCPIHRIGEMVERDDFSFFDEIRPLTEKADLSVVNLECPLLDDDCYKRIEKIGPNLRGGIAAAKSLVYAGFDVATLANNHIKDYGEGGIYSTINALDNNDLNWVGVGSDLSKAPQPLYMTIGQKRMALLNCCEHESSVATEKTAGANPIDPVAQFSQIRSAKNNADVVIIVVHGGVEKMPYPTQRMVDTYRFFIDVGADAVINHHQHCYSGYEVYKEKPIFYGLGNFCFDHKTSARQWAEGYMVVLNIVSDISFEIIPYEQCLEGNNIHLLEKSAFDKKIDEINAVISDKSAREAVIDKYFSLGEKGIHLLFEPYSLKFFKKLWWHKLLPSFFGSTKRRALLNKIECESHRERLLHFLKSK